MVMVAVRGGCVYVWVGGRVVGGGCDVIFNITEAGVRTSFFFLKGGRGYCLSFC